MKVNSLLKKSKSQIGSLFFEAYNKLSEQQKSSVAKQIHKSGKKIPNQIPCQPVFLKITYDGRYLSGVTEGDATFTVGRILRDALHTAYLVPDSFSFKDYVVCGRTDAGVSAVGQVFSLWLRSAGETGAYFGDLENFKTHNTTIDYALAINAQLPKEIRVRSWALVNPQSNARFDATGRQYRYIVPGGSFLNVANMELAGQKLLGEHDYRNFAFEREDIKHFIRRIDEVRVETHHKDIHIIIKGKAFVYHQVRCSVAVLLLIGAGYEDINVIDYLLDVEKCPKRPKYNIAPAEFLIFEEAFFDNVNWQTSQCTKISKSLQLFEYDTEVQIFQKRFQQLLQVKDGCSVLDFVRGVIKVYTKIQDLK